MRLIDLLAEDRVKVPLTSSDRDGAIMELLDLLVEAGAVPRQGRDDVAAAVLKREASQTTGLGGGVAIPHGLSGQVEDVVAALGIHSQGVDFQAVDGAPVRLVILLVVPPNMFQAHIRTLAGIARLLNDGRLRREILAAPDAAAVMHILQSRESATV
jgi:mannitol/fructose-specific phosphotransferase system IIA component (Ntr-type)